MSDNNANAWRCTVCGYVHRGPVPPNECPVCGAPEERFEKYVEHVEAKPSEKPKQWRCPVCDYEHSGDQPPELCPVCATPGKQFEAVTDIEEADKADAGRSDEIIVIGAGIAGISAVESVRQSSSNAKITVLTKEKHPPYYRLNLTRFLAGEITGDELPIHPENWYQENRIRLLSGVEVSDISLDKRQISLTDRTTRSYDKLILTAGAHSFIPPIPGIHKGGVTALRNLDDARYILQEAETAKSVVIIGGGVLGLEAAGALAKKPVKVTLLESFEWLMPRQLNRKAAGLLEKHIEGLGISLKVKVIAQEIVGDERVAGVLLKSGETIPADLVIMAAGIRTNSYLARLAGLRVNHGVIVNDYMQTSAPDVYAAGDVAEYRGTLYGLWNAALYQGSIAGMNAAGKTVEFGGIPRSNSLKVLGVDLLSIGKFEAEDGSDIIIEAECEGTYSQFLFRDSHLEGAILFGNTAISGKIKKAIEKRADFSGLLKRQPSASDVWDFFVGK
ncbi:FAD-dependent oxidoreductase [Desulfobacterales bacterium HSG2]|nr:FAD-dependent oxidoreductase [Desulfobacterales bacterium HSG2]